MHQENAMTTTEVFKKQHRLDMLCQTTSRKQLLMIKWSSGKIQWVSSQDCMTAGKEEQPVLAFPNLSMKWRLASAALVL